MDVRRRKDIRVCEPRSAGDLQKLERQALLKSSATPRGRLLPNRSVSAAPEMNTGEDINVRSQFPRLARPQPPPHPASRCCCCDLSQTRFHFLIWKQ